MCLWVSYKKNYGKNYFFASLKSLKEAVGSGSGFIRQRYGSADLDPHPKCHGSLTLVNIHSLSVVLICVIRN
jgi:hypothetical protein